MFPRVSWIAVTIIVLFCVYSYAQLVSLVCLGCLCEVSTGCNISIGCNNMVCGPFSITKYYWEDVGKPPPMGELSSDDDAFHKCVNDLYCAGYTVQAYMAKHSKRN
ncbi:PREDICTED: lysozyme-like isoform X2 [Acromyrmex echinatior]|uniref:lysozyme-like isoform X2 n=1 Tax=Acromyrmex echinatior TaxID=103372 RepID=UPI000580E1BC|nr:PREDICTED: lysozyme-like isoform X2 [Acromyrmex echinatior]